MSIGKAKAVKRTIKKSQTKDNVIDCAADWGQEFTLEDFEGKVLPKCVTIMPGKKPKIYRVKLPVAKPLDLLVVWASMRGSPCQCATDQSWRLLTQVCRKPKELTKKNGAAIFYGRKTFKSWSTISQDLGLLNFILLK